MSKLFKTWNLQRNVLPRNFDHAIGDSLLVMTERLKLPGEIYSTVKVEAVTAVLIKIKLSLDVTQFRKVF